MVFKSLIPSRFRIGFLGMTACSLLYALRVNLSVAIVAMVNQTRTSRHPTDWCTVYENITAEEEFKDDDSIQFDWNESVQGVILGAYFYGFTITQVAGGLATERWGAKWVCGLGIGIPAIVNALSPIAAQYHYGCLIAIRVIIGAFHGLINASLFSLYAKWFPIEERTIAIAATQFGGNIGAVFMSPISGALANSNFAQGWPSIFYFSTIVHSIWLVMWCWTAHDSPADDNSICEEEHLYILQNTSTDFNKRKTRVPWKSILTSRAVYASLMAKTSGTFGYYVLATSVPSYFSSIFNIKITENGLYTALMYLAIGITLLSAGPLSTYIITKKLLSRTRVRKLFQMIALLGPAVCLIIVPSVKCELTAVIVLIVCSMCLYGFITGGEYPIIPEYAPEFTGTVFGVTNTLASSMGFLAPIIVGQILGSNKAEHGSREKWNIVFYVTAAFYILGFICFELFGSAERQPWAKLDIPRTPDLQLSEISVTTIRRRLNNNINNNTNNGINNQRPKMKVEAKDSVTSLMKKKILGVKSSNTNKRDQPVDTQTPEWITFKRINYVY